MPAWGISVRQLAPRNLPRKSDRAGRAISRLRRLCWSNATTCSSWVNMLTQKSKGEQAEETFHTAGDLRSQAKSLTCMATVAANQGDTAGARSMHEKALALARQTGAQNDIVAGALINLGNLLATSGSLEEVKPALPGKP